MVRQVREDKHAPDNVYSNDGFSVKDNGLGPKEKREVAMQSMFAGCPRSIHQIKGVRQTPTGWYLNVEKRDYKRKRKDLSNLYGMEPCPDDIYDMIMRADNGDASKDEYGRLDEYIKEKMGEIRFRKIAMGFEGGGSRRPPGKLAENSFVNITELLKLHEDEDDYE